MATTKQVHYIARYAHKTDKKLNGIVSYAVHSSNGKDIYCTTLINGKASGCSCPARKPCYHMVQLEAREALRTPVKVVVTESVDNMTMQAVTPVAVQAYRMSEGVREKLAAIAKVPKKGRRDLVTDITEKREHKEFMLAEIREIQERAVSERMMKATLNSNRGFQYMR